MPLSASAGTIGRVPPLRASNGRVPIPNLFFGAVHYLLLKGVAHRGLKGLKIAPFYGCQILRPSKILGFEDPDRPSSLERIIEAWTRAALRLLFAGVHRAHRAVAGCG